MRNLQSAVDRAAARLEDEQDEVLRSEEDPNYDPEAEAYWAKVDRCYEEDRSSGIYG